MSEKRRWYDIQYTFLHPSKDRRWGPVSVWGWGQSEKALWKKRPGQDPDDEKHHPDRQK